jgi:hypothetical protein
MARMNLSREPLPVLHRQQTRGCHDISTLDESWVYFSPNRERSELTPEQQVQNRERQIIQALVLMPTVVWNHHEFPILIALPKGVEFNTGYFLTEMLERIK